jgi:hypothetical protein
VAQDRKVLSPVAGRQPTLIFPNRDIQRPRELVLNPPVCAHGLRTLTSVGGQAAQRAARFHGGLLPHRAGGLPTAVNTMKAYKCKEISDLEDHDDCDE